MHSTGPTKLKPSSLRVCGSGVDGSICFFAATELGSLARHHASRLTRRSLGFALAKRQGCFGPLRGNRGWQRGLDPWCVFLQDELFRQPWSWELNVTQGGSLKPWPHGTPLGTKRLHEPSPKTSQPPNSPCPHADKNTAQKGEFQRVSRVGEPQASLGMSDARCDIS